MKRESLKGSDVSADRDKSEKVPNNIVENSHSSSVLVAASGAVSGASGGHNISSSSSASSSSSGSASSSKQSSTSSLNDAAASSSPEQATNLATNSATNLSIRKTDSSASVTNQEELTTGPKTAPPVIVKLAKADGVYKKVTTHEHEQDKVI